MVSGTKPLTNIFATLAHLSTKFSIVADFLFVKFLIVIVT